MKPFQHAFGIIGILAFSMGSLHAAPVGSSQVSVSAGAFIPTGVNGLDNTQTVGPYGGARYLHQMSSNVSVGGQFNFYHMPGNVSDAEGYDINSVDNAYVGEMVGRYSFMPDATWVPYVALGVGVSRIFQTDDATPHDNTWSDTSTHETRTIGHESSTSYALSYGGGIERKLTDSLLGAVEFNWNTFGSSEDRLGTGAFNFPDVGVRLAWQFGGK